MFKNIKLIYKSRSVIDYFPECYHFSKLHYYEKILRELGIGISFGEPLPLLFNVITIKKQGTIIACLAIGCYKALDSKWRIKKNYLR